MTTERKLSPRLRSRVGRTMAFLDDAASEVGALVLAVDGVSELVAREAISPAPTGFPASCRPREIRSGQSDTSTTEAAALAREHVDKMSRETRDLDAVEHYALRGCGEVAGHLQHLERLPGQEHGRGSDCPGSGQVHRVLGTPDRPPEVDQDW